MDQVKSEDNGGAAAGEIYEDILGDGTLLVKRVVINKNPGPHTGEKVKVCWTRSIPELQKSFPTEDLTFTLGDGDAEQAVELVTTLMKLGEKFSVIAGYKYMYGEVGQPPDIPPKANFSFDIELLSNDGLVDYPTMNFDTRFAEAKKKKERGNILFRRRGFQQALNSYMTAYKIVDTDLGFDYPDEPAEKLQEVQEFRAIILCNTSVAQLKLSMPEAAILTAKEATKILPTYSKAFYRLGQAYDKKGQTEETLTAYKRALQMNTSANMATLSQSELNILQSEVDRLTEKKQQAKDSEKQMYSRMFGQDTPTKNGTKSKGSQNSKTYTSKSSSGKAETDKVCIGAAATPIDHAATMAAGALTNHDDALEGATGGTSIINQEMFLAGMEMANAHIASQATGKTGASEAKRADIQSQSRENDPMNPQITADPESLMKHFKQLFTKDPNMINYLMQMQDSFGAGMSEEEATSMTTKVLSQLGLNPNSTDQASLYSLSEKIAQCIPPDVRAHLEKMADYSAAKLAKNSDNKEADMDTELADMCKNEKALSDDELEAIHFLIENEEDNVTAEELENLLEMNSVDINQLQTLAIESDGAACSAEGIDELYNQCLEVKSNISPICEDKSTVNMISMWEKKIHEHLFSTKVRTAREESRKKMEDKQGVSAAIKSIKDRPIQEDSKATSMVETQDDALGQIRVKEKVNRIENFKKDNDYFKKQLKRDDVDLKNAAAAATVNDNNEMEIKCLLNKSGACDPRSSTDISEHMSDDMDLESNAANTDEDYREAMKDELEESNVWQLELLKKSLANKVQIPGSENLKYATTANDVDTVAIDCQSDKSNDCGLELGLVNKGSNKDDLDLKNPFANALVVQGELDESVACKPRMSVVNKDHTLIDMDLKNTANTTNCVDNIAMKDQLREFDAFRSEIGLIRNMKTSSNMVETEKNEESNIQNNLSFSSDEEIDKYLDNLTLRLNAIHTQTVQSVNENLDQLNAVLDKCYQKGFNAEKEKYIQKMELEEDKKNNQRILEAALKKNNLNVSDTENEKNHSTILMEKTSKNISNKKVTSDKDSWLKTAGYTLLGVGVVGLIGYGIYRYSKK